eukprot:1790195-Amphidinium_carterae.1
MDAHTPQNLKAFKGRLRSTPTSQGLVLSSLSPVKVEVFAVLSLHILVYAVQTPSAHRISSPLPLSAPH